MSILVTKEEVYFIHIISWVSQFYTIGISIENTFYELIHLCYWQNYKALTLKFTSCILDFISFYKYCIDYTVHKHV